MSEYSNSQITFRIFIFIRMLKKLRLFEFSGENFARFLEFSHGFLLLRRRMRIDHFLNTLRIAGLGKTLRLAKISWLASRPMTAPDTDFQL